MSQISNRIEHYRTLFYSNVDFSFMTALLNAVTRTFIVGYVTYLGGSEIWVNAVFATSSIVGILQIPAAIWAKSLSTYKPLVFWGQLTWRFFQLPLLILPFLGIPSQLKLTLLLICMVIGFTGYYLSMPPLNEWLSTLIPANSRGWFFGRRNAIAAGVSAVLGVALGFLLDGFRRAHEQNLGYIIVFGTLTGFALLSLINYLYMTNMPRHDHIRISLKENLKALKIPLEDRNFRKVLTYSAVLTAGLSFGGNLFYSFGLRSLHLPFAILQLTAITEALGNILSAPLWGYLSDKYGNKPVLAIIGVGLFTSPIMWLLCTPDNTLWNAIILITLYVISGAAWGGAITCHFNLILAAGKPVHRTSAVAVALALQAIVGAISPVVGAVFMRSLEPSMPLEFAFKTVFIVTMLIRLSSVYFVTRFKEEGSLSIAGALRQIKTVSPRGFRAFKQLSSSKDFTKRASAIADVGSTQLRLATDEIIKALHDPSPLVRRQSAIALGNIGDSSAVDALIHQLEEHTDIVERETVESLGKLGDPRAIPILVQYLEHPFSSLRRTAARALGNIGNPSAILPLIEAIKHTNDIDLKIACIQSLKQLQAHQSVEILAKALLEPTPAIRLTAADAINELKLTRAIPQLRESLKLYRDDAASEVAYTLGTLGVPEDIPAILDQANQCESIITRRRCLLGVAKMLGVESEVYRLMLLEGMTREQALLQKLSPRLKRSKKLRDALNKYLMGNETEALQLLATGTKHPELKILVEYNVQESFLIGVCLG